MYTDKEYTQTKRIILGVEKMKVEFLPLVEWIDKTYDVKTINIIYDTIDQGERPRLQICFEFEYEKLKFTNQGITYFDKEKQEAIGKEFKKCLSTQGIIKEKSIFDFLKKADKPKYLTENIWVVYGAFEPIAKMEATSKIPAEVIQTLKESLNNDTIWEISISFSSATYFFYTDNQLKQFDNLEVKKIWTDKYFELVKKYDEFDYFKREATTIYFDSKENFDNNYQSSWFYYYK